MASKTITRVTAFKVPEAADVDLILDQYKTLQQRATKDGKPYILGCTAGRTIDDQRNQGYSMFATTTFESKEDMKYYDEQCEAHAALKAVAKAKIAPPPLMMYTEASVQS